ncbi:MAG: glycosyltransferase family 4 protein [Candidatus Diapherotrites archaeon]
MNVFFYGYPGQGGATYLRNLLGSPPDGVNYFYGSYTAGHREFINADHSGRLVPASVFSYTGALYKIPLAKTVSAALKTNLPIVRRLSLPHESGISLVHSMVTPLHANKPWVFAFDTANTFYYFRNRPELRQRAGFILRKVINSKNCKKLIPFSNYAVRTLEERVPGIGHGKIEVIPPGLDIPETVSRRRDSAAAEAEALRILFVSTQFARKGGNVLLEAFGRLKKRFPELELVVVGSGDEVPNGIEGVKKYGFMQYAEIPRFYREADIFCFPSPIDAHGIVLQEAMAFSLPVVATGINAIPEIVEDGKTGVLVGPGSADALEGALLQLIESRSLRKKMGMAGRKRFDEMFGTVAVNKKLGAIYREAVE